MIKNTNGKISFSFIHGAIVVYYALKKYFTKIL